MCKYINKLPLTHQAKFGLIVHYDIEKSLLTIGDNNDFIFSV